MEEKVKQYVIPGMCAVCSVLLYVILTVLAPQQGPVSVEGSIARGSYGSGNREYQLMVEGLQDKEIPVTVTVGAQVYTQTAAEEVFERIMDGMEGRIRGENSSLMQVSHNLKLPSKIAEEGVKLRWYSSDPSILDASGKLQMEVENPVDVILSVELTTDVISENSEERNSESGKRSYHRDYEIPVRVVPLIRSKEEQLAADYRKELESAEQTQMEKNVFTLPSDFNGHSLRYRSREKNGYEAILLVGVLAAVLLWARDQSGRKEKEKKREMELLLDYADLLSKLVVLTGAGLTIRNAWEKMVRDYETARKEGRQRERAAYEEMKKICHEMRNGMSESEAYREFGRRCGLQQYLKLSGLLEQNRRSGTKNLREIFQMEMADALEQRKNLARRLGEEAGTKLLIPLFMMLGIVMVMIMVPAMMTMG